jgi:hypothetical protein
VTAELILVIALGHIELLVGLDNVALCGSEVSVSVRIDVDDGGRAKVTETQVMAV